MQPASKTKNWNPETLADDIEEPPTKVQAIELPDGESDGEYEAVPKKTRRKSPPIATPSITKDVVTEEVQAPAETVVEPIEPSATDDDWLRSRTNRLMDLMEPEEIAASSGAPAATNVDKTKNRDVDMTLQEAMVEEPVQNNDELSFEGFEDDEKPDPIVEAIKLNGRLFVRNLPYSATESDLREHFAKYGSLEEVSRFLIILLPWFYDEYPDRDSLYFKYMMTPGRLF